MTATATATAPARSGERFSRRVVTGCAVLVVAACFGFSFGNVLALGRYLGVPEWVAFLVAPAVDLTVVGLIVGVRHLSLRGVEGRRLRPARLMLVAAGLATWALNTAHALFVRGHLGVVAYDSLAPLLLIGWAEVGPWFLRQFRSAQQAPAPAPDRPVLEPAGPPAGRVDRPDRTMPIPAGPAPTLGAPAAGAVAMAGSATQHRPKDRPGPPPGAAGPAMLGPEQPAGAPDGAMGSVRARARAILVANPQVSGAELARLLGLSEGYGRRLRRELTAAPSPEGGTAGPQAARPDRPEPSPDLPGERLAPEAVLAPPATPPSHLPAAAATGPDRDGHRG